MYLSFYEFMRERRYRMNEKLFDMDMMYKAKIWKAHRQEYIRWCEKLKVFNDYEKIEDEVSLYEARLMKMKYKMM